MNRFEINDKSLFDLYHNIFIDFGLSPNFPFIYFPNNDWKIIENNNSFAHLVYITYIKYNTIIRYKKTNIFFIEKIRYRWGNIYYDLKLYIKIERNLPNELIHYINLFLTNTNFIVEC